MDFHNDGCRGQIQIDGAQTGFPVQRVERKCEKASASRKSVPANWSEIKRTVISLTSNLIFSFKLFYVRNWGGGRRQNASP